jgi:putative thioredoxin
MSHDIQNFATDVIERSYTMPVLVDFWAEWCAPCRVLGPILERLAEKYHDQWILAKVDTEQHAEIAMQYGVRGIPNVKLFVDGEVVDEFTGAMPEEMIEQWLQKVMPSKLREEVKNAVELLEKGKTRKAQKILQNVVDAEPSNHQAAVMLAQTHLFSDHQKAERLIQNVTPDSEYFDLAESIRVFSALFQAKKQAKELAEDVAKPFYLAAIDNLYAGQFEEALQGFLEVIRKNRHYHDDGARKACIAIFNFLGNDHDLTRTYRSELSSALYA